MFALRTLLFISLLSLSGISHASITEYWSAHNKDSLSTIDHSAWDSFLSQYIDTNNDNKVRYSQVSADDKQSLNQYIEALGKLNPLDYNKAEQYAYWVNLYNALTIKIILDHYPVSSIKKIKLDGGLFAVGPWKSKVITINDQELSLDNIEHDILRPIWQDPRTHYAVNCASIGCPNLSNRAFTAANTESLLNENARAFINSSKGVKVDNKKITLSKIYSWFKEDFGSNKAELFAHLKTYADPELIQAFNNNERSSVKYRYDWNLNGIQ